MNRYQQEVAELDRRHRVTVRVLSFAGAGCLAVLALWSAGPPHSQWLNAAQSWWASDEALQASSQGPGPSSATAGMAKAPAATAVDTAMRGTDSSVSPTPLPLYLIATIPGRNKNEGTARIGTSVDNPQTYSGGALLANGTRLAEVHKDHVVLTRGGLSAELYLHQRDPRTTQLGSDSSLLMIGAETAAPLVVEKMGDGLTDYVRPSPVYDGEVLHGYQVYPGTRAAVFVRLGLEPGDVITSINDAPLNEPTQSMELFAQLMRGVAVVATLERKNTSRRVTLDGALISADRESIKEASASSASNSPAT